MNFLLLAALGLSLDGSWEFRFCENRTLEEVADPAFVATDAMAVPGCFDVMPRWHLKHGTGLYRRTFRADAAIADAVLVVDGMGIRSRFFLDGRDLGVQIFPYARLEIPLGDVAAGDHVLAAAVDNTMEWPRVKLARPYYDFYLYGGFYHGVRIVPREPKVFVRTLDYRTGTVEIEIEGGAKEVRQIPHFKLWSPASPNLTTIEVAGRSVRFGIRQIEAKNRRLYLNGREIFLKGFNRHESTVLDGSATTRATMVRDLQNLKEVGGNFIRGAHYQQCEDFLNLCDEMGVLVWEESLGWGNGQGYVNRNFKPNEFTDAEFCALQIQQTREMVRASFNHPSVIISGFLNEFNSTLEIARPFADRMIETIRAERSGHLVTFACCTVDRDICSSNVDLVAFNAYPGGLNSPPGTPADLRATVSGRFNDIVALYRARYPEKPIMVSESGAGGLYGMHDPNASLNTEEFQDEYLRDVFETLWANPEVCGFSIWQMNDGRTRERFHPKTCSAMFGGSIYGCYDAMRRPKRSVGTVRTFFRQK